MQAIREIRKPNSSSLTVELPKEFLRRELEIIVLPIGEGRDGGRKNSFDRFLAKPIRVEHFEMPSREERNAR